MDGSPPPGPGGSPQSAGKGKSKSGTRTSVDEEEADDESSSSSSVTLDASTPVSALENFRKEWEAELKKVSGTSNVNSALNLVTASPACLANPYPNPTSMAGAVSRSKAVPISASTASPSHPFAKVDEEALGGMALSPDGDGNSPAVSALATVEEQARSLFLQGIGYERHGDLYDAVRCYRRAIQLVPDIEYKISSGGIPGVGRADFEDESDEEDDEEEGPGGPEIRLFEGEERRDAKDGDDDDDEEDERDPPVRRFLKFIERRGWIFFERANKSNLGRGHIGDLPVEVVSYILRWVVSTDLDVRSLDVLSSTNKGFYCISRDEKLWQMICERIWSSCVLTSVYSTYRDMFILRPRVRFDGCYISRITYIRPGEHSFQDQSYRPWHFVEYYRYIRFFPDGNVHFLTSSDEPAVVLPGLRDKQPRHLSTLKGTYELYGNNFITAMVKKLPVCTTGAKSKRIESQEVTSFHIEFEIAPVRGRNNWMLKWSHHAAFITKTKFPVSGKSNIVRQNQGANSTVVSTTFDLTLSKYPPMHFSRVKSYTTTSENILE